MMEKSAVLGNNRTGIQRAPKQADAMLAASLSAGISKDNGKMEMNQLRIPYWEEDEKVGSVPIPKTFTGMVQAGMQMIKGNRMQALVDKIGERLAFERSGVRLYEAVIAKCENCSTEVPLQVLVKNRDEELEHFNMLKASLEEMGADPTAVTPGADVAGAASQGLIKVVTDPRTTLGQCLEALLIIELTDNDCWTSLIAMVKQAGLDDLVVKFQNAEAQEQVHLESIRKALQKINELEASLI